MDKLFEAICREKSRLIVEIGQLKSQLEFKVKTAADYEGMIANWLKETGRDPVVNLLSKASLLMQLGNFAAARKILDECYEIVDETWTGGRQNRMFDEIRAMLMKLPGGP